MKFSSTILSPIFIAVLFTLGSCKKSSSDDGTGNSTINNFPTPVKNIAPQSMIDSLRNTGVKVYDGTTPPVINGVYLMTPDSCVYDNSPGNFTGTLFSDYKFRFSAQNNTSFTVTVEQKALPAGTLSPTPAYIYISGSGNNFTVFILRTVSPSGITVEQFNILSGTLTAGGVQNFHNTLYLRSKGSDPSGTLPPAGTIRRFVTGGSGLAATSTTF
ncbi:MAG: hypothetical protein U0V75_04750 [Ferruginibacter sp.]